MTVSAMLSKYVHQLLCRRHASQPIRCRIHAAGQISRPGRHREEVVTVHEDRGRSGKPSARRVRGGAEQTVLDRPMDAQRQQSGFEASSRLSPRRTVVDVQDLDPHAAE